MVVRSLARGQGVHREELVHCQMMPAELQAEVVAEALRGAAKKL
jgi:hypothetical protein